MSLGCRPGPRGQGFPPSTCAHPPAGVWTPTNTPFGRPPTPQPARRSRRRPDAPRDRYGPCPGRAPARMGPESGEAQA